MSKRKVDWFAVELFGIAFGGAALMGGFILGSFALFGIPGLIVSSGLLILAAFYFALTRPS